MPPTTPSTSLAPPPPLLDLQTTGEMRHVRSQARRDQTLSVVLGAVFLAVALSIQSVLTARRATMIEEPPASLRTLALNFPRLTLGGFRGLLATVLWYQAENDKEERKWMDLETKYDIIGAIEPYFVSVYVFHSWNQAYNLSAQWHDQDTKYKWVLDGLSYLYKGEQYNPDNPDLILEEGNLYFLKLGGSFERIYFRAHWRDDIAHLYKLDTVKPDEKTDSTEALRLVRNFVDRDQFKTQELRDPYGVLGHGISITDQWLFENRQDKKAPGDPMEFRYGLSPYYFGYVEFKRSLAAGTATTIGDNIADGWPPMCLRLWCRDDLFHAESLMKQMFGPAADNPDDNPLDPASKTFNTNLFNDKVAEVRDCYRNVDMVAPKAIDAFNLDLVKFPRNASVHIKHIDETAAYRSIGVAEGKLFNALIDWNNGQRKMDDALKGKFVDVLAAYDDAIGVTYQWVDKMYPLLTDPRTKEGYVNPDRSDFERYVSALKTRKAGIENMLKTSPTEKPDMSFLLEEVVEK